MYLFRNRICIFFMILIYIGPPFFQEITYLDTVFDMGKIIIFLILCFKYYIQKEVVISKTSVAILCLHLVYLMSSIYNNNPLQAVILDFGYVCGFVLLTEICTKIDYQVLVDATTFLLTVLVVINCLCFFIFPNGMYNNGVFDNCWLLGYKNASIPYVLVDLFFLNVKQEYSKYKVIVKIEKMCVLGFGFLFAVVADSMTTIIAIMIYCVFSFIIKIIKKRFPLVPILIGSYFVFIGLVVGNFFDITKNSIYLLTGRTATWDVRRVLWMKILIYIKENIWFGNGVYNSQEFAQLFGAAWETHAHNTYLQVMFQGGLLASIIFFFIIYIAIGAVKKYNGNLYYVFFSIVVTFLIIFQSEYYSNMYLFYSILIFVEKISGDTFKTENIRASQGPIKFV